jgi:SpoVK/Ycf46/Vps4 family AAA+-type ATPase
MLALQKTSMEYFPTILTCAEHIAILEALLFKLVKENDSIHLLYNNHFVRFIACNSALVTLNTLVCINAPIECSTLPMFKRMLPAVGYPNSQKQLLACIQDVNCRGVILSGPSGKKVIANNVVVNMARLTLFYFHLSEECVFLDTADSNTPLERFLRKVIRAIPCVLLLDGLDLIAPGFADHDHNSFATHVMKLLKTINSSRITVIASCKSSAKLSKSFLPNRNGFFTSEVHLPRMNATERLEMIENTFMRYGLTDTGDISQKLAIDTAGWVTRDLELFLKTILDESFSIKMDIAKSPDEDMGPLIARLASLEITPPKLCWNTIQAKKTIFELGIEKVPFESHIKRNSWSNIAGYTKQIEQIKRLLFWPHTHRATFERLGIKDSSGILLYGPSGCGKTFLAQALASNSILNFVSASP